MRPAGGFGCGRRASVEGPRFDRVKNGMLG